MIKTNLRFEFKLTITQTTVEIFYHSDVIIDERETNLKVPFARGNIRADRFVSP